MEKGYPPADQYLPPSLPPQPSDSAYPPTVPPNYNQYPAAFPSDPYPPPSQAYPPAAPYPAYPTQPPPYDPGVVQQQQQNNVVVAAVQQQPAPVTRITMKPPNYIALSLINLLCCCWPLGIVGLVYSLRVDSEFNAGRYEEARRASDSARNINYVGIAIGTFLIVGYIIMIIAINVSVASSQP